MKTKLLFLFAVSFELSVAISSDKDMFDEKLAAVYSSLSVDIALLKGEVFMNILPEIERLKRTKCQCSSGTKRGDEDIDNDYIQDIEHKITAFSKAFLNEKLERKSVSGALDGLKKVIGTQRRDMSVLINKNKYSSNINEVRINTHHKEIADMKEEISDITEKTERLSGKIHNVSNQIESICPRTGKGLKPPFFVSDWFIMKSQNESFCERVIEHRLGQLPAKVDVQIKPIVGTDNDWIFIGDSVLQSDDDRQTEYGGIVYFYNQTHVILKAPKKNNNYDLGILMTTAGHGDRFVNMNGDQYRFSEALVRVRIWSVDDFPESTFTSDWLSLDVTDENKAFTEISHGLSDYPAYVSVQIKASNGLVSEGMGALMTSPLSWSNAGGVIYGFDDKSLRIWAPYLSDEMRSKSENLFGRLLGSVDGWGIPGVKGNLKGSFKVAVWSADSFTHSKDIYEYPGNINDGSIASSSQVSFDIDNDLITLFVQALDGNNQGFLFKGSGASQSQKEPFGGAIYAYNKDGRVNVWRPKEGNDGYLVHINHPYGNGKHNQASNAAAYRVTVLQSGR